MYKSKDKYDKGIKDKDDKYIVAKVFKKPVGPIVGFVSQFLFMPLFSFLIGWIITDDYLFRCLFITLECLKLSDVPV